MNNTAIVCVSAVVVAAIAGMVVLICTGHSDQVGMFVNTGLVGIIGAVLTAYSVLINRKAHEAADQNDKIIAKVESVKSDAATAVCQNDAIIEKVNVVKKLVNGSSPDDGRAQT